MAFLARAAVAPDLAAALAPAFAGFVATLAGALAGAGVREPDEARRLAAILDGLRPAVLLGALDRDEALRIVDRHLDGVLSPHPAAESPRETA